MKLYQLLIFSLFFIKLDAYAFESLEITNVTTTLTSASTKSKSDYINLTSKKDIDRIIAPSTTGAFIRFNQSVAVVSFSVLSPKKSKMYLKWDNPDYLYSRTGKEIKFRRAGEYKRISFNATKPMVGNIYLMNVNNKVLRTIKYTVKKQSGFSQSLRTFVKNSDVGDESTQDVTLSYSVSKRVDFGKPRWNMGVSTSRNLQRNNSDSAGISFGYSW